ncbi:cytochrome C5 [Xanthomonas arboricola pv. juglandis]|uniref:Cytochrome C5 n=2 Tax=Xanthomonas TaxID=338 RepID=A0AA46C5B4_9XANT|nr:cytochrome C5 [Xanthomonas euroxanthea]SYZ50884.1 cytochrome C5 [Xanthomonas arboricola pv. juglandis]
MHSGQTGANCALYSGASRGLRPTARGERVRNYDLEFLKKFSMVIGLLVVITLGLIALAAYLQRAIPDEVSPTAAKRVQQRIAPAGAVYAGTTGASAQAAAQAAALAKAASQSAYGGSTDGKTIFDNLCTACHTTGVGKAPTLDHAHWDARIAQGKDTLYKHAIEGYTGPDGGIMPPKGGNPALTEEQVRATVDWMLSNLK